MICGVAEVSWTAVAAAALWWQARELLTAVRCNADDSQGYVAASTGSGEKTVTSNERQCETCVKGFLFSRGRTGFISGFLLTSFFACR